MLLLNTHYTNSDKNMIYSTTARDFTLKQPSHQLVLKSAQPTTQYLLMCVASWCGYCKRLKKEIHELDAELKGRFTFLEAQETDPANRALFAELKVAGYPSLFFIDGDGVVDRTGYQGDRTSQAIKRALIHRAAL